MNGEAHLLLALWSDQWFATGTTGAYHMLLAMWFDNWGAGSVSASSSASLSLSLSFSVSATDSHSHDHGGGHGGHHGGGHRHWHRDFEYERADDHYWDERRKMLERYHHKPVPPPVHAPPQRHREIERAVYRHNLIIERVVNLPDPQLLRDLEDELAQLALQIEQYALDSDDEEAIALLIL